MGGGGRVKLNYHFIRKFFSLLENSLDNFIFVCLKFLKETIFVHRMNFLFNVFGFACKSSPMKNNECSFSHKEPTDSF